MALENPNRLGQSHDADKPRVLFAEATLNHFRRLRRLERIVLCEIPNQDVCIEADHRPLDGTLPSHAPAAMASSISSIVAGGPFQWSRPRKAVAGNVGRSTTVPSGCMKYFTLARFQPQVLADGLRYRRLTFGRDRRFHIVLLTF
jgi:hypothetical protein